MSEESLPESTPALPQPRPLTARQPTCRICYGRLTDEGSCTIEGVTVCVECKPRLLQMIREGVPLRDLVLGPEELDILLSEKSHYFRGQFADLRGSRWGINWNWAAFFFPAPLLFYRKMYLQGSLFFFVTLCLQGVVEFVELPLQTAFGLGVCARGAVVLYGNRLYRQHLYRLMTDLNSQELSADERKRQMMKRGGVNGWAAAAVVVRQ